MTRDENTEFKAATEMTPEFFATFGVGEVAYVRPVETDDRISYAVHAADGRPLAIAPNREAAYALIMRNEMEVVSLH